MCEGLDASWPSGKRSWASIGAGCATITVWRFDWRRRRISCRSDQVVCATQNVKIYSFSSLVDGRALNSLIKYYFGNDIHHSFLKKENDDESNDDRINHIMCHSPVLLDIAFIQNVNSKLGKFPQDACIDERSIVILLAFHASQLISVDRLDMMDILSQVYQSPGPKPSSNSLSYLKGSSFRYPSLSGDKIQELHKKEGYTPEVSLPVSNSIALKENSAIFIQARFRGFIKKKSFLKMKRSAIFLQSVVKAWLAFRYGSGSEYGTFACSALCSAEIQGAVRQSAIIEGSKTLDQQHRASAKIQEAWKGYLHNMRSKRSCSAVKIQSQWRCWSIRKDFLSQVEAVKIIQSAFQSLIYNKAFHRKNIAAIEMQRFIRGHLVRTKLLGASKIRYSMIRQRSYDVINDSFMNNFELKILVHSVIKLQRWWKQVLLDRSRRHAAIVIQSFVRGSIVLRDAAKRKQCISTIQRVWRNILLNRIKKSSVLVIQACIRCLIVRHAAAHIKCCIIKIQRWWRNILFFKKRKTSVLIIQAHLRGWISRQKFAQYKHDIVIIQSRWKGYLVRKYSRPQLLNLRHRMELSAANVNDEMRLINRLVVALTELLGYRSVSNIRQTCATLDRATELSQKCCETLVASGAIDILLKQIQLLNRGVPDQEVLKHVLSTLRNIVRYKHLSLVVINTPRSIVIIFQEILRNKNEGFLISCQLLRRLCTIQEGMETTRKLQGHVKRLNNIIVELKRKAKFFERNAQRNKHKDLTARRLREAISLMTLIADDHFDG